MIVPADNVKSGTDLTFQQNFPQSILIKIKKLRPPYEVMELYGKPI